MLETRETTSQAPEGPPAQKLGHLLYNHAPFPYFGGKSRMADIIWGRLGDVKNYIEPFCGSLAVLLRRPHWDWEFCRWKDNFTRVELANDIDGLVTNVWRSIQLKPDEVAYYASWPVNEIDLTARHKWLVGHRQDIEQQFSDPEWCDPKAAGWWIWGASCWIGAGWCSGAVYKKLPHLTHKQGVNSPGKVYKKLPHLTHKQGVNSPGKVYKKLPHLTHKRGVNSTTSDTTLWMRALSARLRRVDITCGDWSRVVSNALTLYRGTPVGIFFDPPYAYRTKRDKNLYAIDDGDVSVAVREWCIKHGDNPSYRICLAGFEGEHDMPPSWEKVVVHTTPGYGGQNKNGYANAGRERLWFSPHCLNALQPPLL